MKKNELARPTDTYRIAPGAPKSASGFNPAEMEAFEVAAHFGTDMSRGLTKQQVRKSRMEHGLNNREKVYDESLGNCVKKQLLGVCTPLMIASLLVCAIFTSGAEIYTPLAAILLAVLLINAFIEQRAAYSLNKSINNTALRSVVLRDGKMLSVGTVALVPGDIIELGSGSIVPADARLAEANRLCVLETPVTGVKVSTEKDAEYLADNEDNGSYNMVYAGTIVTSGNAIAIVCRTGSNCRLFKQGAEPEEQLPRVYHRTKKALDILTVSVALLCFTLVLAGFFMGKPLVDLYLNALACTLCCMQSSSRALMLTGFALGVRSMYKNSAVLRRPAAVDTLCLTDTVMCDKEVAFPLSELEPKRVFINRSYYAVTPESREDIRKVMTYALLCSDVRRSGSKSRLGEKFYGMPADVCLARACDGIGINIDNFKESFFRIEAEYDKDGAVRRALYLHNDSNMLIIRGKPEEILPLCAGYDAQGTNNRFDDYSRRRMEDAAREMGEASQHVIAVASAVCDCDSLRNTVMAERRLVLNGFIGLYTSLELDSASAVYKCAAGGIETVMLSDDAYVTAVNMARNAGIIENEKQVMSAEELKYLDRGLYIADNNNYKLYLNLDDLQWQDVLALRKDSGKTVAVTAHNTDRLALMKEADASFVPAADSPETVKYAADVLLYKRGLKTVEAVLRYSKMIYKRIVSSVRQLALSGVAVFVCMLAGLFLPVDIPLRLQDVIIGGACVNLILAFSAVFTSDHRRLLEDKTDYRGGLRGRLFTLIYGTLAGVGICVLSAVLKELGGTEESRYASTLLAFTLFMAMGLLFGAEQQHVLHSSAFKTWQIFAGAAAAILLCLVCFGTPSIAQSLMYAMPGYMQALCAVMVPLGVFALFQLVLMTIELIKIYKTKNRKEKYDEIH
ncbi:MAG: cation-transporting P-type ATPase [Ruminococcaceae bacterium]|nr:cation-transporting P-type ATPase [Oscillospiraceae bacterium]